MGRAGPDTGRLPRAASSGSITGSLHATSAVDLANHLSELNITGLQQAPHSASEESNLATPFTPQQGVPDLTDFKPRPVPGAPGEQSCNPPHLVSTPLFRCKTAWFWAVTCA